MFKCGGRKSFKSLVVLDPKMSLCPFYYEWKCKDCKYYDGDKE